MVMMAVPRGRRPRLSRGGAVSLRNSTRTRPTAPHRRARRERQITLLGELDKQGATYVEVAQGVREALADGSMGEDWPHVLRRARAAFNTLCLQAWGAGLRDDARVLINLVCRWFSGDVDESLRRAKLHRGAGARALFRAYLALGPKASLPPDWEREAAEGRPVRRWLTADDLEHHTELARILRDARRAGVSFPSRDAFYQYVKERHSIDLPKTRIGFAKRFRRLGLSLHRLTPEENDWLVGMLFPTRSTESVQKPRGTYWPL
jgi:hypothetical protein